MSPPPGGHAPLKRTRESDKRLKRLLEICGTLPEIVTEVVGTAGDHLALRIRKKIFAYYLFNHHGDGRVALCCKAAPGELGRLVSEDPLRFFVPPYLGPKGWVGVRLDLSTVAWGEIGYLVEVAYRLSAPKTLVARLEKR
ncbi:MAG TPA: MmcQ/YjbR family DNA-binding protein [Candidatus Polarisedimenticolia bacterium]|nr:MmcQ/YjbR family DNA-binding protein [Candidatus Polarisedimenticolia bacterium]